METKQRKRSKPAVLKWMAKDEEAAFKYHVENAWKKDKATMEGIGFPFTEGNGLWWTAKESFKLFKKYAEQGYIVAQWGLACFYLKGRCVKKDLEEAVKWFAKAAEQGNVEAMYCLGECYRDGSGVDEDQKKAVEWFTKAAKQGHEEAKAELEFYNRRESENAFEEDGFLPYSMVGSQNEDVTF